MQKQIEPQYLMFDDTYAGWSKAVRGDKLAFMEIASATNSRSFVGTPLPGLPGNHKVPFLSLGDDDDDGRRILLLSSIMNSLSFDYVLRSRLGGLSISWAMISECPVPSAIPAGTERLLQSHACRLTFVHRRFAAQWLKARAKQIVDGARQWKHCWAVTEADRLRLRVQMDALCADLYGLTPEDFNWIVRDDPSDPKGFWRVDKQLPFQERLTGLAAAAFRAFKEGKWSAESAAKLSNDEFFEIIGIPEMTTGPAPLIRKRTGCHVWKPEAFGPDDPRHGWTWDHCWQDAVALIGSEEAVQKYIEGKPDKPEAGSDDELGNKGPKDLFGNPIPVKPKQGKMF